MRCTLRFAVVLSLIGTIPAFAQVQTITENHVYTMGDNDSKNDARQLCFLQAKRKVLEKAGVYIESLSEVQNFELSKSQIRQYAAAVLAVETSGEQFGFSNGQNTLTCTVRARVDSGDVKQRLAAIATDKTVQGRVDQQQQQIRQLESQVQQLNTRLQSQGAVGSAELRKERNVVIGNLTEVENARLAAINAMQSSEQRAKHVVKGMTMNEVKRVAGEPRGTMISPNFGYLYHWSYGELWVKFNNAGIVECVEQKREGYCR